MAADFYPEQTQALPFDSEQRSLVKLVALMGGGSGGFGIGTKTGVGNPNGVVSGTLGQIYTDTSTDQIWVNNDGGTTWGP